MIGVIINRNAQVPQRDEALVGRLRSVVGDAGEVLVTHTIAEVGDAVDHLVRRGSDVFATCGGDGTHLSVLTQLAARLGEEHLPDLALLRGGSLNTVASNLGIDGRPEELLGRLVALVRAGEAVPAIERDLIVVNGMYGFLFAAAMGARFVETYYSTPKPGAAFAVALALRTVGSMLVQGPFARWLFEPLKIELTADCERVPIERVRLLLASTIPDVGIGMRVPWRAGTVAGHFHLVASAMSFTRMVLQLGRVRAGRPLEGSPHIDRLAREITVRFAAPQVFTLDGDLFHERDITIRIGPRLRILRP